MHLFNFAWHLALFALRHKPRQDYGNEDKNEQAALPCQTHLGSPMCCERADPGDIFDRNKPDY
jgi:hypothetical protein